MAPVSLDDEDLARIERLAVSDEAVLVLLNSCRLISATRPGAVLGERSYQEIAGEMACSPALVRKRVSRGLRACEIS